jgi:hypothetical protein
MTMTMDNQAIIRRHKGSGIASFILGMTGVALVAGVFAVAVMMAAKGRTITPELTMTIGLGMVLAFLIDSVGIVFGFVGAFDRASKKVYPVLGLVLNFLIVALFTASLIIGLMMKAH